MKKIICEFLKKFPNGSFEEFSKYYENFINEKFEEYKNKKIKELKDDRIK